MMLHLVIQIIFQKDFANTNAKMFMIDFNRVLLDHHLRVFDVGIQPQPFLLQRLDLKFLHQSKPNQQVEDQLCLQREDVYLEVSHFKNLDQEPQPHDLVSFNLRYVYSMLLYQVSHYQNFHYQMLVLDQQWFHPSKRNLQLVQH